MAEAISNIPGSSIDGLSQWRDQSGYAVHVEGDTLAIIRSQDMQAEPAEASEPEVSMDLSSYRMPHVAHNPDDPMVQKLHATDKW